MGDARRRAVKKRGIVLATGGLVLTLAVMLALRGLGIAEISYRDWLVAVGVTGMVQAVLWLVPHTGLSERLRWDPHYLILPMTAAALLFGYYTFLVPAARHLLLMAWFVALIFMAGRAGFTEIVGLGLVMTLAWLGGLLGRNALGAEFRINYQLVQASVFMAVHVYAGFVFRRLRRDRREMAELRKRLAEQAVTDALTGVANRRYFEEFLKAELARIDRYGGSCAVAMLDVDRFKNYNDTLGHPAGDAVLRRLARVLEEMCRDADLVSRYGGEEFALVFPATSREEAVESARRMLVVVEEQTFPHESIQPGGNLTVSVGVAAYPDDAEDQEELVTLADRALYLAKEEGRNCVRAATDLPAEATVRSGPEEVA